MIISEFWHHFDFYPQAMVHSGTDKYVYNFGGTDEYYDLSSDPAELHNIIGDGTRRNRIVRLRQHLIEWMVSCNSPLRPGLERTLVAKMY